jgi:hypothetical protein
VGILLNISQHAHGSLNLGILKLFRPGGKESRKLRVAQAGRMASRVG